MVPNSPFEGCLEINQRAEFVVIGDGAILKKDGIDSYSENHACLSAIEFLSEKDGVRYLIHARFATVAGLVGLAKQAYVSRLNGSEDERTQELIDVADRLSLAMTELAGIPGQ